jgi:hypothetical protein
LIPDVSHFLVEPCGCTSEGFFAGLSFGAGVVSLDWGCALLVAFDDFFHFALIFEAIDITSEEKEHAFEPDDHIIAGTSCTEAVSLTKGTESILIKSVFIILSHTILTKLPFTNVLFI